MHHSVRLRRNAVDVGNGVRWCWPNTGLRQHRSRVSLAFMASNILLHTHRKDVLLRHVYFFTSE